MVIRLSRAVVALIAAFASTHVCASSDASQPVCGQDCYNPPTWHPDCETATNNTYCPNAWNPDGIGFQCMAIGADKKSFAATSHWSSLPVTIVHSYPHVKLGSPVLPLELENITSLHLNVEWALGYNDTATGRAVDVAGIKKLGAIGNVAFDIWADVDPVRAANETAAGIEIMIWLGVFGHVNPLGWDKPPRGQMTIGDANLFVPPSSSPIPPH